MDEKENRGGCERRGAGTVNILAASQVVVTGACAMESDVVVGVDYQAKIYETDGGERGIRRRR